MKKKIRDLITYGGLALAGYALLNKIAQPAAAPATAGLGQDPGSVMWGQPHYNDPGSVMWGHPGAQHPAHPWWRWFRGTPDYNSMQNYPSPSESTFGSQGGDNWDQYGPHGSPGWYGGGAGGESTFGGGPYWDYDAVTYEQPGSLLARAAQNY